MGLRSVLFLFLVLQNELRSLEKQSWTFLGGKPLFQTRTFAELQNPDSSKVRVLSRIRRLSRGSTGFFGGNRLSFTNKRPTGRHRSVRKVRSIQIFPVGLIQIFPGNRKGANSNVSWGKKAKPYLTVAPYKVRTSSGPKLPVWNGSEAVSYGNLEIRTWK